MIKIGNRVLICNSTIFIPAKEEAEIEINVADNDTMLLAFAFHEELANEGEDKKKPFIRITGEGNKGKITFVNWTETFGSSIATPYELATSNNGEPIYFLGSAVKIGEMYKVDFQLMKDILQ